MNTKILLLFIIATSLVACNTTLLDVFECIYDDCDDEVNQCAKTQDCQNLLNATVDYGKGTKQINQRYTQEQSDLFYDGQLKKNADYDKLFKCMQEECSFKSLYKCSNKRYMQNDCETKSGDETSSNCNYKFGKSYLEKLNECKAQINKKCTKDDVIDEACRNELTYSCIKDNYPKEDDDNNYIGLYYACEVESSSMKIAFSLLLAAFTLLF